MWRTYEDLSVRLPPFPWTAPELAKLAWREDADAYHLEGALRGFRRKDVRIDVRDGVLDIRAQRERGLWSDESRSFRQIVTLPRGADASEIDARFRAGQLSVRVAKLPHARRRIVPIRVDGELPPAVPSEQPARASTPALQRLVDAFRSFGSFVRELVAGGGS